LEVLFLCIQTTKESACITAGRCGQRRSFLTKNNGPSILTMDMSTSSFQYPLCSISRPWNVRWAPRLERRETAMDVMRVRLLCGVLLCGMVATSDLCAQGPRGVGGDIKPEKVQRVRNTKPEKPTPIYSFPKSEPWWLGGGPGPVGAGVK